MSYKDQCNDAVIIARGRGFGLNLNASNQKTYYMAKTLSEYGFNSYIFSGIYVNKEKKKKNKAGKRENVIYINPTTIEKRMSIYNKIKKAINHIYAIYYIFNKINKEHDKIHLIFYRNTFHFMIPMVGLSKLFGFNLIYNIEEWYHVNKHKSYYFRLKKKFYDIISIKLSKSIITISDYLLSKVTNINSRAKKYILPSLADYKYIETIRSQNNEKFKDTEGYFLYCGGLAYLSIINVIIDSYVHLLKKTERKVNLVLVVYGNQEKVDKLKERVLNMKAGNVVILTHLTNEELFQWYSNSIGLLAPLRDIEQDHARFPQKISEYLATGKPVITNAVGDIEKYLSDGDSALILKNLKVKDLANSMYSLLENKEMATKIGIRGREVGEKHFDYKSHVNSLGDFIKKQF